MPRKTQTRKTTRPKKTAKIRKAATGPDLAPLYRWFRKNKRDLPFRTDRNFYRVWVSEVMLQQTRVAAMLPRYQEFMLRFPDIQALAAASEEEVLAAWRGLGYYSRARNLRAGAITVIEEHGGEFPRDLKAARKLSGVGDYTAAALLSLCYDMATPVIDGNVKRVVARLYNITDPARLTPAFYQEVTAELMSGRTRGVGPGMHNEALMELGAMKCVAGKPDCETCPLKKNLWRIQECRTRGRKTDPAKSKGK